MHCVTYVTLCIKQFMRLTIMRRIKQYILLTVITFTVIKTTSEYPFPIETYTLDHKYGIYFVNILNQEL